MIVMVRGRANGVAPPLSCTCCAQDRWATWAGMTTRCLVGNSQRNKAGSRMRRPLNARHTPFPRRGDLLQVLLKPPSALVELIQKVSTNTPPSLLVRGCKRVMINENMKTELTHHRRESAPLEHRRARPSNGAGAGSHCVLLLQSETFCWSPPSPLPLSTPSLCPRHNLPPSPLPLPFSASLPLPLPPSRTRAFLGGHTQKHYHGECARKRERAREVARGSQSERARTREGEGDAFNQGF